MPDKHIAILLDVQPGKCCTLTSGRVRDVCEQRGITAYRIQVGKDEHQGTLNKYRHLILFLPSSDMRKNFGEEVSEVDKRQE